MSEQEPKEGVKPVEQETLEVKDTQEVQSEAEVKEDRPEENYKAELARKNAEIARLRQEREVLESRSQKPKYDPNDITTWNDGELRNLANSKDPANSAWAQKADDLLLERRVKRIREQEKLQEKRVNAESRLRSEYPEALDPASEFAARMDQVIYDYDLDKSPAGRLAAAKIVASEMVKGKPKSNAMDRNAESRRIADVRGQMVDGDRSKPAEVGNPNKKQETVQRLSSKNLKESASAMGDLLKEKGITSNSFFKH